MAQLPINSDPNLTDCKRLRSWVAAQLLPWFAQSARPLPWRRDRNPYAIWVSEVMLQQTQTATVIPYFERFLRTFPTVDALASADEQQVLKMWEGLGYYRRARDLHRAAQMLVQDHGGVVPQEMAVLCGLPGFGRYTAGAVLSQAYEVRAPIIEANTRRLWARFFACENDLQTGAGQRWLWQVAEEMLPDSDIGHFNQALMELGALVCTVQQPACERCPLAAKCRARQVGRQAAIPAAAPKKKIEEVADVAVVIRRGPRFLLVQRRADGRWPNMWEFPHASPEPEESINAAAVRLARELTGLKISDIDEFATLKHSVTRFRITLTCVAAESRRGEFASQFYQQGQWLMPEELGGFPISSPQRKLAKKVENG